MQMHNGGVPFSRPGPGSREMVDGMEEEDIEVEEERRRRRGGAGEWGPGRGGGTVMLDTMGGGEGGGGGMRASGMVGFSGGSNFGDDASRNGEGFWMDSQPVRSPSPILYPLT